MHLRRCLYALVLMLAACGRGPEAPASPGGDPDAGQATASDTPRSSRDDPRRLQTDEQLALADAAMATLDVERASTHLTRALEIWPQAPGLRALRERIDRARHYGAFGPGQGFREILSDGGLAPEMVVLPRGVFLMGSPDDDPEAKTHEKPRRQVRFLRGYAIGRNEVTVADYRRFVEATGYSTVANRGNSSTVYDERGGNLVAHEAVDWRRDHAGGPATDDLPVLHVAFEDAQAYAAWISQQTGQRYRLPSEAEWEYALRGGRDEAYPWGSARPRRLVGNLAGAGDRSPRLKRRWGQSLEHYRDGYWGPAPVRSFRAEAYGTHDMIGNVAEWTEDCWHDSYRRAPADGRAWVNPGCRERVLRGASWAGSPDRARSAHRQPAAADTRNAHIGFRLVREL